MSEAEARPRFTRTIATLGPAGTDAHALSQRLSDAVRLFGSFREAMEDGCSGDSLALVPCGAVGAPGDPEADRWVDLHFEFSDRLEVLTVLREPTKPMCVAARGDTAPLTIAVHPATRAFARRYMPGAELRYVASKPIAVDACVRGDTDACIGSLDVVQAYTELQVHHVFHPEMLWVIYAAR